jgi:hypothetical protein
MPNIYNALVVQGTNEAGQEVPLRVKFNSY